MSERTDDPTFKNYDYGAAQKDNFSFGGHMYLTTNEGHDSVHASQTSSPGMLNKFDQEQNKEWWAEQRKSSHADRGQAHGNQPIKTSIGERASNPNYDNDVHEGVTESDRVRRGYLRAEFARNELESNPGKWANKASGCSIGYPKCNEFIYESHF